MGSDEYGRYLSEVNIDKAKFYGDAYISDTITCLVNEKNKELSYRYYVTDALHAIAGNTAGDQRASMTVTFREMWEGSAKEKEEQVMSPEEIIEKMKEEFKKKGGAK